jgi:hypothetical protein
MGKPNPKLYTNNRDTFTKEEVVKEVLKITVNNKKVEAKKESIIAPTVISPGVSALVQDEEEAPAIEVSAEKSEEVVDEKELVDENLAEEKSEPIEETLEDKISEKENSDKSKKSKKAKK